MDEWFLTGRSKKVREFSEQNTSWIQYEFPSHVGLRRQRTHAISGESQGLERLKTTSRCENAGRVTKQIITASASYFWDIIGMYIDGSVFVSSLLLPLDNEFDGLSLLSKGPFIVQYLLSVLGPSGALLVNENFDLG